MEDTIRDVLRTYFQRCLDLHDYAVMERRARFVVEQGSIWTMWKRTRSRNTSA